MALEKINDVKGKAVFIPGNDIDTDRIIPARFMVCVTFEGLGQYAFYDERKNADGSDKVHPLTDPRKQNAKILLSGANFGCGSSREHAPQSLWHYGFRAIVAESFAEIFFGNSTTLGIPCVCASHDDIAKIGEIIEADPDADVDVNVEVVVSRFFLGRCLCIITFKHVDECKEAFGLIGIKNVFRSRWRTIKPGRTGEVGKTACFVSRITPFSLVI